MINFDNKNAFKLVKLEFPQNSSKNSSVQKNRNIRLFEINYDSLDEEFYKKWGDQLRSYYIDQEKISGYKPYLSMSNSDYLKQFVFPSRDYLDNGLIRIGDFGEILVHDFIVFIDGYFVSKVKYKNKERRNTSPKGVDVIGYKINDNYTRDELFLGEVKTSCSKTKAWEKTLELALKDSIKTKNDIKKIGESLNYEKKLLLDNGKINEANVVARFQNMTDNPFNQQHCAIAVLDKERIKGVIFREELQTLIEKNDYKDIDILIIYSEEMNTLMNRIWVEAESC